MGKQQFRVLFVVPSHFFADYGCHVRILEEAEALQSLGHMIDIETYPGGRDLPQLRVRRSRLLPHTARVHVGSSHRKIFLDAVLALQCFVRALRSRPDVIHGHLHEGALIGLAVGRLLRIPVVFDYQGSLTAEMIDHHFLSESSLLFRPLHFIERMVNRHADAVLISSKNAAGLLFKDDASSADMVHELSDCVSPHRFDTTPNVARRAWVARKREKYGIPPDHDIVVYIGLLAEYQGISDILKAAADVITRRPQTHFLLMGYPGEVSYRGIAEQLGISDHVTFPGRIPYEEAAEYLSMGSVAVSAKLSKTEGNGKLLDYMAMGLPTVVYDTAVARELMGDCALYAPAGNFTALADHLAWALSNQSEAQAMGARGRRRVLEHFTWQHAATRIVDLYSQVTETAVEPSATTGKGIDNTHRDGMIDAESPRRVPVLI